MTSSARIARAVIVLFAAQLFVQCTAFESGTEVTIALMHHEGANTAARPDGQARVVSTDLAYTVTLTRAHVAIDEIEIIPCTPPTASALSSLVSVAHAHDGISSPTVLHVDHTVDLLTGDLVVTPIGMLLPPPGDYCGAIVRLEPVDGRTIRLDGTYAAPGREPTPFFVELALSADTGIAFDGTNGRPEVLSLNPEAPSELAVGMDYALWFDGIDFETYTDAEIETMVLRNVLLSLHHHDPLALR